jgi:hypothetical protein
MCGLCAACVRLECGLCAAGVRLVCGWSAACVRLECGLCAACVRLVCGSSADEVSMSPTRARGDVRAAPCTGDMLLMTLMPLVHAFRLVPAGAEQATRVTGACGDVQI